MRLRVLVVMWALVLWGLFEVGGGLAHHAYAKGVICSGINVGPDREEHPSPMHPGDTCHPRVHSSETRSYDEQRAVQRAERDDVVIGSCVLGTGTVGLIGLFIQGRMRRRV
ncbi:hypothetical protein AB0L56_18645 [Streptomyces sp. NPDC052079]|uniref:hypothetical protein n=1 Tax=Streptomyces sp. NPDC052079 TaxID=3155526 RepID=UPI003440C0B2